MTASTTSRSQRPLTGPFWAAVDRHELIRPVCDRCHASFFSPQVLCPTCQSPEWTWQTSVGTGHVYSHTTVHRPPDPTFEAPYVVADVEVDEGWRLFTWIVDCEPSAVHIDQRVQVRFVPGVDGETLPAFAPLARSEAS